MTITELWMIICAAFPSITAVLGTIVGLLIALKKFCTAINEFRNSNEIKQLIEQNKQALQDNAQLKKMNEKLIVELTRIKPQGWTDDQN